MINSAKSRQRALIMEKEPRVGDACGEVLARLGFSVDVVPDVEEAMLSILGNRYDLCIMDMLTPGSRGYELYAWLNDFYPELIRNAIFTTGDVSGDYRPATAGDFEHVFLEKPFTPEELVAAVEMALN